MRRVAAALGLAFLCATPALADYSVSGRFLYVDREFDGNGFTGVEPQLPIRFADVQVVDGTKIVGAGVTDALGNFAFRVQDSRTRDIYVRCLARRQTSTGLPIDVRAGNQSGDIWSIMTQTFLGHLPTQDLFIGTLVATPGAGGEAFNLLDVAIMGGDYLAYLRGPGATPLLIVVFNASNPNLSSTSGNTITMARNAGYDDTVLLHEMGHYVIDNFSKSDSPGGTHNLSDCNQNLMLAWDEGHATAWGLSVRRYFNLPHCSLYVRTTGLGGAGNLQFSFDVETQQPFVCFGATSETTVFAALWDTMDDPSTPDETPGTDEAWDLLQGQDAAYWKDLTLYLPGATNISLEDFWDGWFHPTVANGHYPEMKSIFRAVGVEYFPDDFEPNDLLGEEKILVPGTALHHLTYFADRNNDLLGEPDTDLFAFDVPQAGVGKTYAIETLNLLSDANTSLDLLAADGATVLASNNDRSAIDASSLILYTPSAAGRFYVRSTHAADFGIYGSYDFRISIQGGVDADGDGYTSDVDCDDTNPAIHPGAAEICNGVDDNCNLVVDEGFDGDVDGYTTCGGDCNDANPQIHPNAPELCNGIDDNCNLVVDEGFPDTDGDGLADCVDSDDDNDGVPDTLDCAPLVAFVSQIPSEISERVLMPLASVIRITWDPLPQTNVYNLYRGAVRIDQGWSFQSVCLLSESTTANLNDAANPSPGSLYYYLQAGTNLCGEGPLGTGTDGANRPVIQPCAPQGRDSDQDLVPDLTDNCPRAYNPAQADADRDGRGDACDNCVSVPNPNQWDKDVNGIGDVCQDMDKDGFTADVDCRDDDASVHPGAPEICDGKDNDCDGVADEGFDQDGDGYTTCGGDCADTVPSIHPGAVEVFNGVDDDCNGIIDDVIEHVAVSLATYQTSNGKLTVEATTNYPVGSVTLSVVGFGPMTWVPSASVYRLVVQTASNPGTVTVVSTAGGSATRTVTPL